jgi:hypothetical protein
MWALILVTFAVADPLNARFNPVFFSQEYSSQERCEAAKSELRKSFVEKVEGLNRVNMPPRSPQVIALTSRPWSCRKNEAAGLPKTSQRTE